jgi:hypothetical protein
LRFLPQESVADFKRKTEQRRNLKEARSATL